MPAARNALGRTSLSREYYTSPAIAQMETERIFRRSWLCAGRADALAQPGRIVACEIEGESLLVLRGREGRLRCFYNVCRHRGARLCPASTSADSNVICCPYHGWTYDLEGRLIAAPNMAEVAGFRPADYPLKAVRAVEWEGFVFVNLSLDVPAFEETYRPLLDRFRPWRLAELVCVHRMTYEVRANWKLLFENFSECYHCAGVHPRLNALSHFLSAENELSSGPFLGGPMRLADGVTSMSETGSACGEVFPELGPEACRRVYYFSLFPTLLLSPHPDYVLVHRIQRQGLDATRVDCELLFPPQTAARRDFDPLPAVRFWDETNRQDWRVCELSQQGICSTAYEPGPLSNLESIVAAFDAHYLQALYGDGPTRECGG